MIKKTSIEVTKGLYFTSFEHNKPAISQKSLVVFPGEGQKSVVLCQFSVDGRNWLDIEGDIYRSAQGTWWSPVPVAEIITEEVDLNG